MAAPTHIEIYISAMKCDGEGSRLATRTQDPDFYDVEARQVETDPLHRDWTGEIVVLDEVENIQTYKEAVQVAKSLCAKHGLPEYCWEDIGG